MEQSGEFRMSIHDKPAPVATTFHDVYSTPAAAAATTTPDPRQAVISDAVKSDMGTPLQAPKSASREDAKERRRTRGMSVLPMRQAGEPIMSPPATALQSRRMSNGSPPTTPGIFNSATLGDTPTPSPGNLHSPNYANSLGNMTRAPGIRRGNSINGNLSCYLSGSGPDLRSAPTSAGSTTTSVESSIVSTVNPANAPPKISTPVPSSSSGMSPGVSPGVSPDRSLTVDRSTITRTTPSASRSVSSGTISGVLNGSLPQDAGGATQLSTYLSQLAGKESRVGELRHMISSLELELKDAEADLAKFKQDVKLLAELQLPGAGASSTSPNDQNVLHMGKRVVDEIGTHFWTFVDDLKSATMGNADFEQELKERKALKPPMRTRAPSPRRHATSGSTGSTGSTSCSAGSAGGAAAIAPSMSTSAAAPASPPERRLSPKRSMQNLINRSPSPIWSLSPSRSPEEEEHRATQRLRESQRLTKKLSHIDLRSPSR